MIKLDNIVKIYGINTEKKRALDGVSLEIADGELVSIIGPSGSGKSTLLNIIGCMDEATEGKYFLDDTEITSLSKSKIEDIRKDKIGFVFQHFALMDYYTAYENIELPLLIKNVKRAKRKKMVNEQLEAMGIADVKNNIPAKMSGGQRQRALIAMVIAQDTEYVLLDEPTNNLDIYHATNMMKIVRRLCDELGKTVVLVLHEINYAAFYSDYICAFANGRIAKFGTVEEVMTKENLSEIYKVDFEIQRIQGKPLSIYY